MSQEPNSPPVPSLHSLPEKHSLALAMGRNDMKREKDSREQREATEEAREDYEADAQGWARSEDAPVAQGDQPCEGFGAQCCVGRRHDGASQRRPKAAT